jgi:hypothetical protein
MAENLDFLREMNKKWFAERRPQFVDSEKNSFECFLEEIEIGHCFPENEELAKKIIDTLKQKYNLIF